MTTNALIDQNPADRPRTLPGVFGIDETGARHRLDRVGATIIVTRDDEIERIEQLAPDELDRALGDWLLYVAEKREWVDHWLDAEDIIEAAKRHEAALDEVDG